MVEMTPRERVLSALNHKEPDRVPLDFGSTAVSSIVQQAYEKLKAHLGIKSETKILGKQGMVACVDEEILKLFKIDTRSFSLGAPSRWKDIPLEGDAYRDEWGIEWRRPPGTNSYFHEKGGLEEAEDTIRELERYPWPDPTDPGRYEGLKEKARKLHEGTDYAVIFLPSATFFADSQWLRGFEKFYTEMVTSPSFIEALMDKVLEIKLEMIGRAFEEVKGYVDVVMMGDDIGVQNGPMMSLEMYRKLLKPRQARLVEHIKKCSGGAKVLHHCCGSIYSFLREFIELGIDAIHPVQVSARDMGDTKRLKREFGGELAFWGAIDTGRVMPFGTPEDVRAEVKRRIEDLAPGGGYILNSVHNLQAEVKPENVCTMFEAALEYGSS